MANRYFVCTTTTANWSNKFLNGRVGLFRLYNRILSPEEIQHNFNIIKSKYNIQ